MPAKLLEIDRVCGQVRGFLAQQDLETYFFEVSLVIREALVNAVVHGCHTEDDKLVRFSIGIENGDLVMEIEDPGGGFDWRKQRHVMPTFADCHGRGMSIFDHYCRSYEYNEKGNLVRLYKSLTR
ncbi:MAG: ATP-binding protein [Bacteroidales bacterium]|nr:ATP-binding protein [Bacteroidales bacterium]